MPALPPAEARHARFTQLFREHAAAAYRTLICCGVPAADAEDCVTRVFEIVLERLEAIRSGAERAYICGVAAKVASNARRLQRRRTARFTSLGHDEIDAVLLCRDPSSAEDPEQQAIRSGGIELLARALEEMSAGQRAVFVLCELERRSTREAAEALAIAETAVEARRRKARAAFARFCERLREAERSPAQLPDAEALQRWEKGNG
jgi:RNA polymerase sigma factor (sigma-70 family)